MSRKAEAQWEGDPASTLEVSSVCVGEGAGLQTDLTLCRGSGPWEHRTEVHLPKTTVGNYKHLYFSVSDPQRASDT